MESAQAAVQGSSRSVHAKHQATDKEVDNDEIHPVAILP